MRDYSGNTARFYRGILAGVKVLSSIRLPKNRDRSTITRISAFSIRLSALSNAVFLSLSLSLSLSLPLIIQRKSILDAPDHGYLKESNDSVPFSHCCACDAIKGIRGTCVAQRERYKNSCFCSRKKETRGDEETRILPSFLSRFYLSVAQTCKYVWR